MTWVRVERTVKPGSAPYRRGSLYLVSDACYSGCWARALVWMYVELRGFGSARDAEVKRTDPRDQWEPISRIMIQTSCGMRVQVADGMFAPLWVAAQLDPGQGLGRPLRRSPPDLWRA